jgi:maltooligosyltrehalose trehalohydrolase
LRFFGEQHDDRLLVVNLGVDFQLQLAAEPLLAPPSGARWKPIFSTESVCYGGCGAPPIEDADGHWWLPGHAATVLAPEPSRRR